MVLPVSETSFYVPSNQPSNQSDFAEWLQETLLAVQKNGDDDIITPEAKPVANVFSNLLSLLPQGNVTFDTPAITNNSVTGWDQVQKLQNVMMQILQMPPSPLRDILYQMIQQKSNINVQMLDEQQEFQKQSLALSMKPMQMQMEMMNATMSSLSSITSTIMSSIKSLQSQTSSMRSKITQNANSSSGGGSGGIDLSALGL